MSDVKDCRDDLIAKITAAVGSAVTVAKWAGEDAAMSSAKPGVLLNWIGGITGENEEIGARSFPFDLFFHVIVQTADTSTVDGDDAAAAICQQIREAILGQEIVGLGLAQPYKDPSLGGKTEAMIAVHAGVYEYVQSWRIGQYVEP